MFRLRARAARQLSSSRTGAVARFHPAISERTPSRVLKDVTGGRVDAGVVFMSDAMSAGNGVSWFALPGDAGSVTSWITVIKGSAEEREATQFVQEVTGADR